MDVDRSYGPTRSIPGSSPEYRAGSVKVSCTNRKRVPNIGRVLLFYLINT